MIAIFAILEVEAVGRGAGAAAAGAALGAGAGVGAGAVSGGELKQLPAPLPIWKQNGEQAELRA